MPQLDRRQTRAAAVAGTFYENSPAALRRRIAETALALPTEPFTGTPVAVVLPHAGYVFSLATALKTILPFRPYVPKRVVILGPPHYVGFRGMAAASFRSWQTPFGALYTDWEAREKLLSAHSPLVQQRDDAHLPEHSLEVQLPVIQYLWGNVPILPLLVGTVSAAEIALSAEVLRSVAGEGTFFLISSDFTHYGSRFGYTPFAGKDVAAELHRQDSEAARLIAERDYSGFAAFLNRTGATICGANAIALLLKLLEFRPEKIQGEVVSVTDSGTLTGDYSHVVGYVGIRFFC